jgi:hypothetical protein
MVKSPATSWVMRDWTLLQYTVLDTWLHNGRERMLHIYSLTGFMMNQFFERNRKQKKSLNIIFLIFT